MIQTIRNGFKNSNNYSVKAIVVEVGYKAAHVGLCTFDPGAETVHDSDGRLVLRQGPGLNLVDSLWGLKLEDVDAAIESLNNPGQPYSFTAGFDSRKS